METAEHRPIERETIDRRVDKAKPPFKRKCEFCGRETMDEHETICIECGAVTKEVE